MAKQTLTNHMQGDTGLLTSTDVLFHLRCNETTTTSNLADAVPTAPRTMTQTGAPGIAGSAVEDSHAEGARTFNGTTQYAGRAASDSDHTLLQGEYGYAFWCYRENATSVVMEYGEWSSPETQATNVQLRARIFSGQFQHQWERGTGGNFAAALFNIPLAQWCHVGVAVRGDPKTPGLRRIEGFLNGELLYRGDGFNAPDGGTSSRWIIGASRDLGTAVGTPGSFFQGRLDDIIVTKFAPDVAWFRAQYARGKRDWNKRHTGAQHWQTHVRVLVNTTTAENDLTSRFSHLGKVDLDWVDLSSIKVGDTSQQLDFLSGDVEWGDGVDDLVGTARFSVFRAFRFYNMSPFVTEEGTDKHNPLAAGSEHLLRPMRRVRIETAIVPATMHRSVVPAWAWEVQFDGFIRSINVADDTVQVTCADFGIALLDVFMEPTPAGGDRLYGSPGGSAIEGQLDALIVDNSPIRFQILSIDDNGPGNAIVVTTFSNGDGVINGQGRSPSFTVGDRVIISGTTNYNTPAGSYDTIASVASAAVTLSRTTAGAFAVETPASGFLVGSRWRDYKGSEQGGTPQLWVPVSPSWTVYQWNEPASKSVLQALDDIVSQIGWRIRYRWHEYRQQFRLALYNPAAFNSGSILAWSGGLTPSPIMGVGRMSQNVDDVRNIVAVEYYREAAKAPRGERTINLSASGDFASVALYGRRYCRVNVGSDSLVNRINEASALASRMRADLSQPIAETELETLYDDRVQVADTITITDEQLGGFGAPMFFSLATLEGSCIDVRHRVGRGKGRTVMRLRNLSAAVDVPVQRGPDRYAEIVAQVGALPGRGLSPPATPAAPTTSALGAINGVRHVRVRWAYPGGDLNASWLETEVHFDTVSNFTPTSSTLTTFGGVVRGTTAIFGGFTAGVVYYCRIVSVDRMGNRSAVSAQSSFTA